MADRPDSSASPIRSLVIIAAVVAVLVLAFVYTAGWLSPGRLTPRKIVGSLAPASGPSLGFRRNHAKGICFTGTFESGGAAAELSKAQLFAKGSYPVLGRFNLATADPNMSDAMARVRGLSLRIVTPDGSEWRSAMIDAPFFPVATVDGFYALQRALADKSNPDAMKNFAANHPEIGAFGKWAGSAPWTGSYAEDRYNSLNSFVFTNAEGKQNVVRWSFIPAEKPESLSPDQLKARGANFLDADITQRVQTAPQRWSMTITVANPGDPTADPSKAWPQDRRSVDAGVLVVKNIEPEPDGPCRDINFDPTVLPAGIAVSDDPFPAARSAAYSVSFNRRTAEEKYYPRDAAQTGAKP